MTQKYKNENFKCCQKMNDHNQSICLVNSIPILENIIEQCDSLSVDQSSNQRWNKSLSWKQCL